MQLAVVLLVSLTLLAAPCVHCRVQPADEMAGHDCCPKQKQSQDEKNCTWLPAEFVTAEGKVLKVELQESAAVASESATVPPAAALAVPVKVAFASPPSLSAPPLFLAHASLLI